MNREAPILAIGGNGFIGSHVVEELLAAGHSVVVYDRSPEGFRPPTPGLRYICGSLEDVPTLAKALQSVSAVIHLASTTVPATSDVDPVGDIIGNLVGTVRLLEQMRTANVRRILYVSSGGTVYGVPETDPIREDHPLRPFTSYGIVKVAIENFLRREVRLHGLSCVVVRPSNPYGPRQGNIGVQGLIGTLLWRAARNERVEIWGDGHVERDYIYVKDLAHLCRLALESGKDGCFNAGSGIGRSVNEIIDLVCATVGSDLEVVYRPGRAIDVPRVVLDASAAKDGFGWVPSTKIELGLSETWSWVVDQLGG